MSRHLVLANIIPCAAFQEVLLQDDADEGRSPELFVQLLGFRYSRRVLRVGQSESESYAGVGNTISERSVLHCSVPTWPNKANAQIVTPPD